MGSSDTLSPAWIATNSRARSRRPIQVARSGAAKSVDLLRLEVLDQSPLVSLAGKGEDAATLVGARRLLERDVLEKEWIAARRVLRLLAATPRSFSR
jgi:hypothetical protein